VDGQRLVRTSYFSRGSGVSEDWKGPGPAGVWYIECQTPRTLQLFFSFFHDAEQGCLGIQKNWLNAKLITPAGDGVGVLIGNYGRGKKKAGSGLKDFVRAVRPLRVVVKLPCFTSRQAYPSLASSAKLASGILYFRRLIRLPDQPMLRCSKRRHRSSPRGPSHVEEY
jgi:hypothetical protein